MEYLIKKNSGRICIKYLLQIHFNLISSLLLCFEFGKAKVFWFCRQKLESLVLADYL